MAERKKKMKTRQVNLQITFYFGWAIEDEYIAAEKHPADVIKLFKFTVEAALHISRNI